MIKTMSLYLILISRIFFDKFINYNDKIVL